MTEIDLTTSFGSAGGVVCVSSLEGVLDRERDFDRDDLRRLLGVCDLES